MKKCTLLLLMPISLWVILMLGSCRKLLRVPAPTNELDASAVFSNDTSAVGALIGLYIAIMNNKVSMLNGGMSWYGSLSSDDIINIQPNPNIDAFRLNDLTAYNLLCRNLYTGGYNVIYAANSLLAGLDASTGVTAAIKTELRGEGEFVRALMYFYLVNLYGGVPLVSTTDAAVSATQPRASVGAVYAQIVSDLEDAQQVLSPTYISNPANPRDRARPNQAAATALLARVYLYEGYWEQAEAEASLVIGNPLYSMVTDLDSVFLADSREAIWQLQPVYGNQATVEGAQFVPTGNSAPQYELTATLLAVLAPGDQRRVHWTDSVESNSGWSFYPYKYKLATNNPSNTEYEMVLRLAEMYLIRAEAEAWLGQTMQSASDLNIVRARAGLTPTTAITVPELLTAIAQERQVEFFAECGHRWLDLLRTGAANAVLGAEKPTWTSTDVLYPIPETELNENPRLTQNPGY